MAAVLAMAAAGVALPGQAFAAAGPDSPTPPPGGICHTVVIIGARGSGQAFNQGGPFHGYGPEVWKAVSIVEAKLKAKGIDYAEAPVAYPADSVNDLKPSLPLDAIDWPDYIKNHLDKFLNSITKGVNLTVNYAKWGWQTCHNAKIIMAGYSQGAMVMHRAELQLKKAFPAAYNLIIGTLLVADGDRVPNTKAKPFGSSPAKGEGVESWLIHTVRFHLPYPDVPKPATTANVCNNNDIVCDFSASSVFNFSADAAVHTQSYAKCGANSKCTYGKALINGATWLAGVAASKA